MQLTTSFDALHQQAMEATGGLGDFGSGYEEALRLLLRDYDRHAGLDERGRQFVAGSIVGDLCARLLEEKGYQDYPQYAAATIEKPIIIVGMARTGTTVLQRLIGADPALQTLPLWLALNPMPRPPRDTWERAPAFQQVQQALAQLHRIAPQFAKIHPQSADAADECRLIIAHSFIAPNYAMTAHIPEYIEMVDADDGLRAYQRHRKTLGLIGGGSSKRWLLKCPTHLWKLPALMQVYPDACLVVTHRDPVYSMTSIINLVYELMKMIAPNTSAQQFGRDYLALWSSVLNKAERDRAGIDPARIFDIHFDDIKRDPIGSVERIYRWFDIPITPASRAAWQQRTQDSPDGGHAVHHYTPEDFGLTAANIRDSAGAHYQRYLAVDAARKTRGER
jgi:Sulfotransferase family